MRYARPLDYLKLALAFTLSRVCGWTDCLVTEHPDNALFLKAINFCIFMAGWTLMVWAMNSVVDRVKSNR